jgi:hypothetical protein
MREYCQVKGAYFNSLKVDRESRFTATLTSAVYRSGQYHAPAGLPRGKTPATIEWEVGWAPVPVRTFETEIKLLSLAGIRPPDHPASSLTSIPTELSRLPG